MTLDMSGGGTLSVREDGLRVYLEARREADGLGLYKVWLTGRGSGRFLLGTLAPEGEGLRLRRNLSRTQLEMADCWRLLMYFFTSSYPALRTSSSETVEFSL